MRNKTRNLHFLVWQKIQQKPEVMIMVVLGPGVTCHVSGVSGLYLETTHPAQLAQSKLGSECLIILCLIAASHGAS